MTFTTRCSWLLKKSFWNGLTRAKYRINKPVRIPPPRELRGKLQPIKVSGLLPEIPIHRIPIADRVPEDEASWRFWRSGIAFRSWVRQALYTVQKVLQRVFPPMQKGLPPIEADPLRALDKAYTRPYRKLFEAPVLPAEYVGEVDLGRLAVESPYACYLKRAPGNGSAQHYQWDFWNLGKYEHHEGLHSLGVRVLFRAVPDANPARKQRLEVEQIETRERGVTTPGDPDWTLAREIALCAATTHMSLVRHFCWTHLVGGSALAIATRNCLPVDHPVRRLLWPHTYGTQDSTLLATKSQLTPGGDFETTFSFSYQGLCGLLEDSYDGFNIARLDPTWDAQDRRLSKADLELPVQENRQRLFKVMYHHARNYLGLYYNSDANLLRDSHFRCWEQELERLLPHGTRELLGEVPTLDSAARLIAAFIFLESVEHESIGTNLWNYQLWPQVQPVRVYRNGERVPLDVYQRLINANFILNVHRANLLEDFSYLALDNAGALAMRNFRAELQDLQHELDRKPVPHGHALWRIEPKNLEVNINA